MSDDDPTETIMILLFGWTPSDLRDAAHSFALSYSVFMMIANAIA